MTTAHDDDATPFPSTTATPATPATSPPLTDDIRAKRVAVARDVRERIALGKLRLTPGAYLYGGSDWYSRRHEIMDGGGDLQPHADLVESRCDVCALGAVLLSKARVMDAVPASVLGCHGDLQGAFHDALSDVFDGQTLYQVESAFVRHTFGEDEQDIDMDLIRGAVAFGRRFDDKSERCDAVMARIIDGNGEFIVEPMSDRAYHEMMGCEVDQDDDWDD